MRLYLVRHGQTAWNEAGRMQGHTDIPLDAIGQSQADALGEAFRDIPLDRVLSSDLGRAYATAKPIAAVGGLAIEMRKDLRERSFGDWEGSDATEVAAWSIEKSLQEGTDALNVQPPNGESFADVWNRLDPFVSELDDTEGRLAVVTHGVTSRILLAKLTRGTLATSRSFTMRNTGVTELERRADGFFVIVRYNDVSHLTRPARPLVGSGDAAHR
jgi:broad specificity phosphatase PhoE